MEQSVLQGMVEFFSFKEVCAFVCVSIMYVILILHWDEAWKTVSSPCANMGMYYTIWHAWREVFTFIVRMENCHPSILQPKSGS